MPKLALLVALALLVPLATPAAASEAVLVQPVAFSVRNPNEPWWVRTVRGKLYLPAGEPRCSRSVMLLLHGLSYASWAWDFPLHTDTYSVARALASRGFPAVAIDELGYGTSDQPDGHTLTVQAYADMTAQMVRQLRAGSYRAQAPIAFERVGLFGHSAGTEMAELTAGLYGGVDVLVASAYSHFPTVRLLSNTLLGDTTRALLYDEVYFGGTPERRAEYMYNLAFADPDVVALDTRMAELTPSGEIISIDPQPSRTAMELITAPVLLLLAEKDALFPPVLAGLPVAELELALFLASADRTLHVVPGAGHSFMLHPNAPETNEVVLRWLTPRLPACAQQP